MVLRRIFFQILFAVFWVAAAASCAGTGAREVQTADMAYNGGVTYMNQGDYKKAIESFTQAISLDPRYQQAYGNRALSYEREGQYSKAIDDYTKAIELGGDRDKPRLYELRGQVYQQTGDLNKALADYTQAITRNGKSPAPYLGRGLIYLQQDKLVEAVKDAQQVTKLDPNNAEAYALLASIDEKQGNLDQAVQHLSTAILKRPLPGLYYARASILYEQGKLAGAQTDLETYFSLTQKSSDPNKEQAEELLKAIQSTEKK